jgi:hypothetical protein
MKTLPSLASLLTLIVLATACAGGGSAAPDGGQEDAAAEALTALDGDGAEVPAGPGDLRGLWASTTVFRGISLHPLLGPLDERTTVVALVEVRDRQEGPGLEARTLTCFMDMHTEGSPVQSAVPMAFLELLGPSVRPLEVGSEGASVLSQPPYAEVFAVKLDQPLTEDFPSDPDDGRIFDHDGDQSPGLTVRLTGLLDGQVFVAQRRVISWQATWDGQGYTGTVAQTLEELVLGAEPPALLNLLPQHLPAQDPAANTVEWHRLPAGSGCGDLALP